MTNVNVSFKEKISRGDALYGLFVAPPSPATVELIGYAGFDFVVLDMEHGPSGYETLENMLRAADAADVASIVRLPNADSASVLHALDCGAAAVLVPHTRTADEAANVVAEAHFPPRGRRGISTFARSGKYGMANPREYLANRHEHTVVMVMIEDVEALAHVDAISEVNGVDVVFIGPSDLAASMGHVGNPGHPDVSRALSDIRTQVRASGGPALMTAVRSHEEVEPLMKEGVRLFCFNATGMLTSSLTSLRARLEAPASLAR